MLAGAIASRPIRRPALLRWVQPLGESGVFLEVNGVNKTAGVDMTTLQKEEGNGIEESNTLTFTCWFDPPSPGQEVILYRGSTMKREFGGHVTKREQFYDEIRHNIGWRIRCQDYSWLFNEERYSQRWTGATSATTIATAIVALKTGFTSTNVQAALANVTDFEIINKTRGEALKMLADLVPGASAKIDYTKDVHFRTTPVATELPADITDVTASGDLLRKVDEMGQIRTRQRGLGVRVRIPSYVPATSTTVPVETVDQLPASGQLQAGTRILSFSAQTQAQNPGGIAGTAGAPTVALASSPAGGVLGAVRYMITFELPDGETAAGTQSAQVTGATLAAPSAASAVAQHQVGVGVSGGDYYVSTGVSFSRSGTVLSFSLSNVVPGCRVYIFGTSSGVYDGAWTITSVSGSTASIDGVSSSAPSSDSGNLQVITDGPLVSGGTFSYKIAWLSALGISALSSAFTISPAAVGATASATATGTTGGSLTLTSTYTYFYTPYTENAEASPLTLLGSAYTLTGGNNAISLAMSQLSNGNGWHDGRIRGMRIYRGKAGEVVPRLVADLSRSTLAALGAFSGGWTYIDTTADTSLGSLPRSGVMGAAVGITSLPSWSDGRITGLMILRTVAGGSDYFPVGTVNSSSVVGFLDTMSDADLVRQSPAPVDAFGGHTVTLTSIATATGATARNIYRLLSGVWRYCGTIPDNTTTTFSDGKFDKDLGAPLKIGGYLTGISPTSDDIPAGTIARLHVLRNDSAAQTALAALLGTGNGVREGPVLDDDTLGQTALETACDAELDVFSASLESGTFRSRDVNYNEGPGKTVGITLGDTTDISVTFVVQRVVTSEYMRADDLPPLREVTGGPVMVSLRKTLAA